METKTIYREYFPNYGGHIPMQREVIGMTVGATNNFIKSYLTREPEYEQKLVPSTQNDYSYYNKGYFNENFAKEYRLEEDKVFSNKSKEAKTWINGSKFKIFPQHIPGYKAHIPGIYSSNIIGMSYAKCSAVAVKGEFCKKADVPPDDRYKSVFKRDFVKPKMRSEDEDDYLRNTTELRSKSVSQFRSTTNTENTSNLNTNTNNEPFKQFINYENKQASEVLLIYKKLLASVYCRL
jgi:hypothetical protein